MMLTLFHGSFVRRVLALAGLSAVLWVLGLALFVMHIETLTEPPIAPNTENTDAIVVLTGGSERTTKGVTLLKAHLGKKLFISGVHQGLSLDHVTNSEDVEGPLRSCCIVLGYAAESTQGNADETQLWMTLEHYHSMRLVTANYHMPRSLLLFHNAMPDIKIIPHPVTPDSVKLDMWWQHSGTASLLVTEYVKYIIAFLRIELGLS